MRFDNGPLMLARPSRIVVQILYSKWLSPMPLLNAASLLALCTDCYTLKYNLPNRQYLRKATNDWGWNWAPQLLNQGIWQDGTITQIPQNHSIQVQDTVIDLYRKGQVNNLPPDQSKLWVMNVSIDYLGSLPSSTVLQLNLLDHAGKSFYKSTVANLQLREDVITGSLSIPKQPELWWPAGYGSQTLYTAVIDIVAGKQNLASVQKKVGFRTIVLNQQNFTESEIAPHGFYKGSKWLFEINGHELYIKGSNYVPQDPFWPRITSQQVEDLFKSVLAANQNLLRVWASGSYLPDFVYDLADQYGVLLWSEFEFTDAIYPVDPLFLANVREEVRYQVRRVNHHPSLALWCGNNEIQYVIEQLFAVSPVLFAPTRTNFETLFLDVIINTVFENTRSISYLPSSVNRGYISFNHGADPPMVERYGEDEPSQHVLFGNSDYYNYEASQALNETAFPIARFGVEFGFISHAPYTTYQANMPASQLHYESESIVHRNHYYPSKYYPTNLLSPVAVPHTDQMSRQGIADMTKAMKHFYPTPSSNGSDGNSLFIKQIYATQLFHAEWDRTQIEFYRRGSGLPQRNMGSTYWMLNDIWATVSWASLSVDGRWKAPHYVIKNVYSPVIIAPYVTEAGAFSVWATSDLWSNVAGTASLKWYDWSGKQIENSDWTFTNKTFTIGAINSTMIFSNNIQKLPASLQTAVAFLTLSAKGPDGTSYTSEREYHPLLLSTKKSIAALRDPKLKLGYDSSSGTFTIISQATAAFVWLEHPASVKGHWSDNAFWMLPGQREVRFIPQNNDPLPRGWEKQVQIMSIWDLAH